MRQNRETTPWSVLLAFVAAVVLATLWGAIVQTQFNLAALAGIGAELPAGLRIRTTLADIFSGFSPTYAAYVVAPSFLVAGSIAWLVADRWPGSPVLWFVLAGTLAIALGIPLVNYLAPVALLIGASRDWLCTALMALGGGVAGWLFAALRGDRRAAHERPAGLRRHQKVLAS